MQIIKNKDKYANFIFYAMILIHVLVMCSEYGEFELPMRGRLLQLAFGLGCIKIILTHYEKFEWTLMSALGIIGVLSYMFSKEKYVLYVVVIIFAAKSMDIKRVLKLIAGISLVSMLVVVLLSLFGVGGPISITQEFRPGIISTRYCLGYAHPNNLHGTYWYITSLLILVYKDKINWIHYSILSVINAGLFVLTDSKAGLLVTFIMLLVGLIYKYASTVYEKKITYIVGCLGFLGILLITVIAVNICPWYGYGPILAKIDSVLTGRVSIAYNHARMSWWHMFYGWQRPDMAIVDNGFAMIGVKLGIVVWILYVGFNALMLYVTAKNKNGLLFGTVIAGIAYAFIESTYVLSFDYILCNIVYIVAMIYMGMNKEISCENSDVGA